MFGGLSGMGATIIVQPLDLVKTRLQLAGQDATKGRPKSAFGTIVDIVKKEGPFKLYSGLSAAIFRQLTYSTTRFGSFQVSCQH